MYKGKKIAAICVSQLQDENNCEEVHELTLALQQLGWKSIVFNSGTDLYQNNANDAGEAAIFQLIDYRYIDVVVILAKELTDGQFVDDIISRAHEAGKPIFYVHENLNRDGVININTEFDTAFRQLVTHVVEHHHVTKIACIAGFQDNPISDARTRIYREVLEEHQIPFYDKWFGYGDFYSFPACQVLQRYLDDPDGLPEAIVCFNDSMAIAICEKLIDRGIRIPEDIIVTGFDGIVQEKYNVPRLTTCRFDCKKFSKFVADLIQRADSGETMEQQYYYSYTLDVSQSCGCKKIDNHFYSRISNALYTTVNGDSQYNRSMNNMLTKLARLTQESDMDEIREIIRYYLRTNGYICLNSDFFHIGSNQHTYFKNPYTQEVLCDQFFYEYPEPRHFVIPLSDLVSEFDRFVEQDEAGVVYSIHSQGDVYGYVFAYAGNFDYIPQRMYRFVTTLNSCISLFVQQNAMRQINEKLMDIQSKIIVSFADMVESRDDFTGQHIKRTSAYLRILVKNLSKKEKFKQFLSPQNQELMCQACPLHDIGKIKISDSILNKPGKLTDEEFEVMKTHTTEGYHIICRTLTDIEGEEYLSYAKDMALYHHEKWNGKGYPMGLSGMDIPLSARIMAVVDVFDALTSKRVYKEAFSAEKAFAILRESSGSHFDPDIVSCFLECEAEVREILEKLHE